jgi:hypothetical protein
MDFAFTQQQELIKKEVAALARSFSIDYWLENYLAEHVLGLPKSY